MTPAAVGAGVAAGAAGSLLVYALAAGRHPGGWPIFSVAVLAAPATAGLVAAWRTPRRGSPTA